MSPHGEQSIDPSVETGSQSVKLHMDRPDDVVGVAEKIWTAPILEGQARREVDRKKMAEDRVQARIISGEDLDEYKEDLYIQLEDKIQSRHELAQEKQGTLAKENLLETKQIENHLSALATFDAREKILAQLASGANLAYLLKRGEQVQLELQEKMQDADDRNVEFLSAKELLPHVAYMRVLEALERNPASLNGLRETQRALLNARLKTTGGIGGTHETEMKMKTPAPEDKNETPEQRAQMLLEKKWTILKQELQDTEKELAALSWFQRMFGEKGKFLKARLVRVKADQERVSKERAKSHLHQTFDEVHEMLQATRKE